MSLTVATHSGPFHADDVLACALLRVFVDAEATVTRTREPEVIDQADVVVDVGGRYEPEAGRFDHHQAAYEGPFSSAGMILAWLADTDRVGPALAERLRREMVDYVDDVDNGRRSPDPQVPCFPLLVQALNQPASSMEEFDAAFAGAVDLADACVRGMVAAQNAEDRAARVVIEKMQWAEEVGSNLILLDEYVRWKPAYFANGGETHPTEFVIHPGPDGSWRAGAIPPTQTSFAQKVSLPLAWAGLTDAALEAVTGVAGARFCHKNRFITVFSTRDGLLEALSRAGLVRGPLP
jgi:uncharacterized UPF0160 family protein